MQELKSGRKSQGGENSESQENSLAIIPKYDDITITPDEFHFLSEQTLKKQISALGGVDGSQGEHTLQQFIIAQKEFGVPVETIEDVVDNFLRQRAMHLGNAIPRKAREFENMLIEFKNKIGDNYYTADEIVNIPGTEHLVVPESNDMYGKHDYLRYETDYRPKEGILRVDILLHKKELKTNHSKEDSYYFTNLNLLKIIMTRCREETFFERLKNALEEIDASEGSVKRAFNLLKKAKKPEIRIGHHYGTEQTIEEFLSTYVSISNTENKDRYEGAENIKFALTHLRDALYKDLQGSIGCVEQLSFDTEKEKA